jgi:hypothetical protein
LGGNGGVVTGRLISDEPRGAPNRIGIGGELIGTLKDSGDAIFLLEIRNRLRADPPRSNRGGIVIKLRIKFLEIGVDDFGALPDII